MNIKKPAWMYYAAQAQKQLDDIKPSKSGKREEEHLYRTWLTASEKHGYPGLASDLETLVRRIARGEIKLKP
jgi:hypothetical protein